MTCRVIPSSIPVPSHAHPGRALKRVVMGVRKVESVVESDAAG